ncbi:MAG: hypothetical protein Kow0074_12460 [Candidatus Zixiibacteriota bacterium]
MDDSTNKDKSRRSAPIVVIVALMSLLFLANSLQAQIVSGTPSSVSQRFSYLSWTLKGDTTDLTISQWYLPIVITAALQEDWELSVYSSVAASDADWDIADGEVSGLTDSRIQLAHSLADDRILLSGGVSLPTGQTELNESKRSLIPWLTEDFLTFPIKYHGEGLNLYGGVAGAVPAGNWALGLAVGLHLMGEYTPYEDGPDYKPGSRVILTGSAERQWPEQGSLAADLSLVFSGNDEADGTPVFSDGTMLDARFRGRREFSTAALSGGIRLILRGKNDILDLTQAQLVSEENNTNGSEIRLFISGQRDLGERVTGSISVESRLLAANDYEPGSRFYEDAANILGIGAGIDIRLSRMATGGLGVRIWNGSSDGAARFEALDLKGFELTQRLTLTM